MPLVTAAKFFDGNADDGSIAANLIEHPGVARFAALSAAIGVRPDGTGGARRYYRPDG